MRRYGRLISQVIQSAFSLSSLQGNVWRVRVGAYDYGTSINVFTHYHSSIHLLSQSSSRLLYKSKEMEVSTPVAASGAKKPLAPVDTTSPANAGFISVLTPGKVDVPHTEEFDVNGVRMYDWSSDLKDGDVQSAYFWSVCCCPCLSLAQLEVRMGLSSYAWALAVNAVAFSGFAVSVFATVITLLSYLGDSNDDDHSFTGMLILLALVVLFSIFVANQVAKLRTKVRERYEIPGSEIEDRYVGCYQTSRAIRQMGKQLKCDRAHLRAPSTLQAYQV